MRNQGESPGVWPCDSSATVPEQAKSDLVLNQNQLLSWLVLSAVTETPASRRDRFWWHLRAAAGVTQEKGWHGAVGL